MNEINEYTEKIFEDIKHIDENGNEYWYARELQHILEYNQWRSINDLIMRAKVTCKESKYNVDNHFAVQRKMIKLAKNATREISDYKLSRYACYLIVMNGNPNKKIISLGQTYFAIQTRKQELSEKNYNELSEDEKRFYQRNLTRKGNFSLNQTAKNCGVKNFDKFHNAGYKGLYNGKTANDIAKRKKLRYREDILDNMGSDELIANLFRISQTEQKLKNENIKLESDANKTHYEVGKKIRNTIEEGNKIIYKTDNDILLAVSNDVDKNRIVNFEMENIKKVSNDEKIELVYHIYFESAKKGLTPIFKNIDELNLEFKQNAKYVKDVNPIKFDGKIKLSDEVSFYTCIELPLINAVKELNDMGMTTLMSSANKIDVSKRNEPIKELTNHGNGEHFNLGNGYSWIMIDWESLSDENKRQFILMNNGSIPINLSDIALNNLKHNCEINKLPVLPKELISFYEVFDFRVFLQDSSLIGKLPTDKPEDFQFQKSRRGYGCVNSLCNHGKDYRTVVIRYPLDENTTITEVEEYYRNIIKNLSRQDQVKHSL